MSHKHPNSRVGSLVVLIAFAAGALAAQLVPAFRVHTTENTLQSARQASIQTMSDITNEITGVDVDMRHLNFVSSIS
jgi:hypothetical protein